MYDFWLMKSVSLISLLWSYIELTVKVKYHGLNKEHVVSDKDIDNSAISKETIKLMIL
jgi:hypothetical protein